MSDQKMEPAAAAAADSDTVCRIAERATMPP